MYLGNVLNLGFCAGLPHLRQAFSEMIDRKGINSFVSKKKAILRFCAEQEC